jgi:hypothetical protein
MGAADNIHTLRFRDVPLCVECLSCGHRSLMEADNLKGLGKNLHDMVLIRALEKRLRCRQCKAKDVKTLVPTTRREAKRFIEGVRI